MKNLILTMTTALILLTGCSKDEFVQQIEEQSIDLVYVLDQNMEQSTFNTIEIDNSQNETNFTPADNAEYGYTSGLFKPTYRDPVILSWSANQDATGTYGIAELQITRPTYNIHILMKTECISVDGNTAMFGGIITEVLELSGDTPPLTEMWRFYFQIKDNNQTSRDRLDQISNKWIFASPRSQSLCSVYPPNHRIWSSIGHQDVINPGFVEVSTNQE